ncbi:hypothetical protein [Nitratireductor soli]|uniref:hypothetical protein n=1 Tax=Nitratireductor soli TaxID=1670619 RepID=UPI00065E137B|nr:hypothetical protein [Nitratireductor soli]
MTMPRRREPESLVLPLLTWPQARLIERMEAERAALAERIAQLPRHAHYRLALETRLRDLTAHQMMLEIEMKGA